MTAQTLTEKGIIELREMIAKTPGMNPRNLSGWIITTMDRAECEAYINEGVLPDKGRTDGRQKVLAAGTAKYFGKGGDGAAGANSEWAKTEAAGESLQREKINGASHVDALTQSLLAVIRETGTAATVDTDAIMERVETRLSFQDAMTDAKLAEHETACQSRLDTALGSMVRRVVVEQAGKSEADVGVQHETFPALLRALSVRAHVYLVGPAGSGKTHAAEAAAKALGIEYSCTSFCQQTSESRLVGYMSATGEYVSTVFRKMYEHGGVWLADEIDNGNANTNNVLNSALSNGVCSFPDGMVAKHPDFACVAAANTYGTGADRQYVGRCQLDAASLSRFVFMEWNYDEKLELHLASNDEWTKRVQCYRKAASSVGLRVVISPRASITGAKLIAAGFTVLEVERMTVFQGLDSASISKLKNAANL